MSARILPFELCLCANDGSAPNVQRRVACNLLTRLPAATGALAVLESSPTPTPCAT